MDKIEELQFKLNSLIGKEFTEDFTMSSKEISKLIGVAHEDILERIHEIEGYNLIECKDFFNKGNNDEYIITRQGFIAVIGVFDTSIVNDIVVTHVMLFEAIREDLKNYNTD